MEQTQTPDPREKENQDEQSNTGNQANELLEEPNNDEEVITTGDAQKFAPGGKDKEEDANKVERRKEQE